MGHNLSAVGMRLSAGQREIRLTPPLGSSSFPHSHLTAPYPPILGMDPQLANDKAAATWMENHLLAWLTVKKLNV